MSDDVRMRLLGRWLFETKRIAMVDEDFTADEWRRAVVGIAAAECVAAGLTDDEVMAALRDALRGAHAHRPAREKVH
jgi:hypothetical protein